MSPKETDLALAEIWKSIYKVRGRIDSNARDLLYAAGAKFYYRGRQRVTDMSDAEALEIVTAKVAAGAEWKATHTVVEADGYESTDWMDFPGIPYELDSMGRTLANRDKYAAELASLIEQRNELEATYTGWSRFFLVTSSAGHVHSSMSCSTCRPTTTYGWLPELSDTNEADAVDELGPTLCSVCFPSAPTEWTAGKKLTAAQAAKRAA
jgi:hypothetical protein